MSSTVGNGLAARIRAAIRDVPDFPKAGILFKDITPLLSDPGLFPAVIEELAGRFGTHPVDHVVGIESRGFIFASPVAMRLGGGFVPIRKPGKLPHETLKVEYDLEYGSDALEAHVDAIRPGDRVLLVDDVLATGGTAAAAAGLVEQLGGRIVGAAFVLELAFLGGRERLPGLPIHSLVRYESG